MQKRTLATVMLFAKINRLDPQIEAGDVCELGFGVRDPLDHFDDLRSQSPTPSSCPSATSSPRSSRASPRMALSWMVAAEEVTTESGASVAMRTNGARCCPRCCPELD
jgi:hypothetical protein